MISTISTTISAGSKETAMTTISIKYLILSSTLSILLLSPSANAGEECVICPDGLEFPDALIPRGDGRVSCTQGVSIFSSYDRNSCVVTQVDVVPICCPSQFRTIAAGNICGWCAGNGTGIETLETTFRGPLAGMGDATCADILPGIALATDTTGCSIYEYAQEYCCPTPLQQVIDTVMDQETDTRGDSPMVGGDSTDTPPASSCHFCENGIELPSARPIKGDEMTCDEAATIFIQIKAALVHNAMACKSYRQLEYACCPSSIYVANPVGNGDEHVAGDIAPKEGEQETGDSTVVEQSGQVTIDTEMDKAVIASVDDGGSTSGRDGDVGDSTTIITTDVPVEAAGADWIFTNHGAGGVTVNKDATASNKNNKDVLSTGGEVDNGLDYDIIYPDEYSSSGLPLLLSRTSALGSISLSCGLAWIMVQSL